MKYIRAIKYIDAVSREKQHELPDPLHIMIALRNHFGFYDVETFRNYKYFKGSVNSFKQFLARSRDKQMKYCYDKRKQLKRCIELINALATKK